MSDNQWRQEMRRNYDAMVENGRRSEWVLRSYALPEGFHVAGYSGNLVFSKYGFEFDGETSLAAFHRLVREATAALGVAPRSIDGGSSWGSKKPDLRAYWILEGIFDVDVSVHLVIQSAKDCKVDPRHPGYGSSPGRLHPECQDVLAELEDEVADLVEEEVA